MPKKKKKKTKEAEEKPRTQLKVRQGNPKPRYRGRTREDRMLFAGLVASEKPELLDRVTFHLCAAPKQTEKAWKKRKALMEQWEKDHEKDVKGRDFRKHEEPSYAKIGSVKDPSRRGEDARERVARREAKREREREEREREAEESALRIRLTAQTRKERYEKAVQETAFRKIISRAETCLGQADRFLYRLFDGYECCACGGSVGYAEIVCRHCGGSLEEDEERLSRLVGEAVKAVDTANSFLEENHD
jgi:hypothetical protein